MSERRRFFRTTFSEQPTSAQFQEILEIRRKNHVPVTIYGPDENGVSHPSAYLYFDPKDIESIRTELENLMGELHVSEVYL